MKRAIVLIFFITCGVEICYSTSIDSLNKAYVSSKSDAEKSEILKELIAYYLDRDSAKCFSYIAELNKLSEKSDMPNLKAFALLLEGHYYKKRGDNIHAIKKISEAISIGENNADKEFLGKAYNDIGAVYADKGDYDKAASYLIKALRIFDNFNNPLQKSKTLLNLGLISYYQKNYNLANDYYEKALQIRYQLKDSVGIALILNNMGILYYYKGDNDKAIQYFKKAIDIYENKNARREMSLPLFNIGEIYFEKKLYDSALCYYNRSYAIDTALRDKAASTKSLTKIAAAYASLNQFLKALDLAQKSLKIAQETDSKEDIKDVYLLFSEIYKDLNNYKQAYHYLAMASEIKDSLYNSAVAEQVTDLQIKYETEKKDLLLQQQIDTIKHQKTITRILTIAVITIILFLLIAITQYVLKRKAYDILKVQKKNITDSINYASKIQSAILPPEDLIKTLLPESFVLFLPKEVVSGDFYWITQMDDRIFVALADCTGHGVPGAFMSMLGFAFLNEIASRNPNIHANEILDQLGEKIKQSLHQTEKSESKDGMDISMLIYFPEKQSIEYAGANNSLIICRDSQIIYLPADKKPIGFNFVEYLNFSLITFQLEKNDTIYLYSDGYMDQFGGPKMKKLGKARFEEILIDASALPIKAQRYYLEEKYWEWLSEIEQIDDISIMGIKIV
jgi:serine phosphatase RsbU (regulator of sigma subunit)/Tfp pilus assembly protein PilF